MREKPFIWQQPVIKKGFFILNGRNWISLKVDYIITRARSIENGIVYFDIPFRRFYVTPEEMKKLPVSELSERVAAEDGTTGRTVTKMKIMWKLFLG